ncbi:DUF5993 family protein [Fastidiosibacter lacustris]|uniref:DUF5993 family protein n=1 Tax=Fastidiosibacter lacustris TaxID=2056695 RepID=UPI001EFDF1DD|nr:DUF5993 family protein [Fastidiosibacter lacustris]
MPGILITFILLLISVISSWFYRKLSIILFCLTLIFMGFVFLHHATDNLGLYF